MQDSPVGVRDTDYNSVFSSGQTVAATFDRSLFYARGYAMGSEHKAKGVTVQLGPVAGYALFPYQFARFFCGG
jgi:beta-glucosidase